MSRQRLVAAISVAVWRRPMGLVVGAMIRLALGPRTWIGSADWRDDATPLFAITEALPGSVKAPQLLAQAWRSLLAEIAQ